MAQMSSGAHRTLVTMSNRLGRQTDFRSPLPDTIAWFVMDADGGNQRALTDRDGYDYDSDPSWSPDGEWIAFEGTVGTGRGVFLIKPDGTAEFDLTGGPFDQEPDWQPTTMGNVNCRSGVNSVDALLILQLDARLLESLECSDRADVNDDGETDSLDAVLVLQFAAGVLASLPA